MANKLPIDLSPAAAITAPGNSDSVDLGESLARNVVLFALCITAWDGAAGTGFVRVVVQTSPDDSSWRTAGTVDVRSANAEVRLHALKLERYVRLSWSLGGGVTTASLQAPGAAHTLYCDPDKLKRYGLPEAAMEEIEIIDRIDACLSASDEADGYLAAAYTLPLAAWSEDLATQTAKIAVRYIFDVRGWDPGNDSPIETAHTKALSWLGHVAKGLVRPPGIVDSTPEETGAAFEGGSVIVSQPRRNNSWL